MYNCHYTDLLPVLACAGHKPVVVVVARNQPSS
jgi:hypothetical protein